MRTRYRLATLMILAMAVIMLSGRHAHAACAAPAGNAGEIVYNQSAKVVQYCNGTVWKAMNPPGSGSGGCSSPSMAEGTMAYNTDSRTIQLCAGNIYKAIGPAGGKVVWKQISVGGDHSCGIKSDDSLWCWGFNSTGQLGDNSTTNKSIPTAVSGGNAWKQVSAGHAHTCGIMTDDSLWCWGANSFGQTGLNTSAGNTLIPSAVSGGGGWKLVSASSHTCAIQLDDTLWCWGGNFFGKTGLNTSAGNTLVPTAVSGGGSWKQVSAGVSHSCGIKSDDSLWCWGANNNGQLGDNSTTQRLVPTAINGGGSWKQISAGSGNFTCAIKSNDGIYCWGLNMDGQLGDNSTIQRLVPTAISGGGSWKRVTVGGGSLFYHSCGIKSDDTLWCWGSNGNGQLGDNTMVGRLVPTAISVGSTWMLVDAGGGANGNFTCGILLNGYLQCWGSNANGRIGDNSMTQVPVPTAINSSGSWKEISAGVGNYSCGIKSDDSLWCWGLNGNGQLGDNTSGTNRLIPTAVNGGGLWKKISTGNGHSCGIKSNDSLWCWGLNGNGQLGDNTSGTSRLVPTAISGGGAWKLITNGTLHTCAIKSDDTLHCWGLNTNGQLGDNSTTQRLIPTAIDGGGSWKQVSAGSSHSCGIKSDYTLHCWGLNTNGQLGDNSTTQRLIPTAIDGGGSWKQVSAGSSHSCGIKSDDTLHCWGANSGGRTGLNTSVGNTLIPTVVDGGSNWKQVVASAAHTCGIRSDDTLYCWGSNSNGQLGDNSTTQRLVPAMVNGGGNWSQVEGGSNHSCAIAYSNNMLLCWGGNSNGQITATNLSVPYRLTGVAPMCGGPAGEAGDIVYNADLNVVQYCDGVGWVRAGW